MFVIKYSINIFNFNSFLLASPLVFVASLLKSPVTGSILSLIGCVGSKPNSAIWENKNLLLILLKYFLIVTLLDQYNYSFNYLMNALYDN